MNFRSHSWSVCTLSLVAGMAWHLTAWTQSNRYVGHVQKIYSEALSFHLLAADYQAWSDSTSSPSGFSEALEKLGPEELVAEAVCEVFKSAPREDLFYVFEYSSKPRRAPCVAHLRNRYQNYLSTEQSWLSASSLSVTKKLGPSIEVPLDPTMMPTVIDGDLPAKVVSLSFDDGPHASLTPDLLKILNAEGVTVNFFMVGRNSKLLPGVAQAANAQGHELGTHSFTHPDLRKLSTEKAISEIEDGFTALAQALGQIRTNFRFPYGAKTPALQKYLIDTGTPDFFWNIDTLDWKYKDPTVLFNYTVRQIEQEGHGVILMHDIQPQTIAMLPGLLDYLKTKGYKTAVMRPIRARTPR